MKITRDNYLRLKRMLVDELESDVTSSYQLGSDELSEFQFKSDARHLRLLLTCFEDSSAVTDLSRAIRLFHESDRADAEDQIDAWLDRINLD